MNVTEKMESEKRKMENVQMFCIEHAVITSKLQVLAFWL